VKEQHSWQIPVMLNTTTAHRSNMTFPPAADFPTGSRPSAIRAQLPIE